MNDGRIVEVSTTKEILSRPLHKYTKKIVEALPIMKMDYLRPNIEPFRRASKVDYLVDIPITFEVFPNHFAHLRDDELHEIQKIYSSELKNN